MADEIPEQKRPEEESKKDTVRINLPPGLTGRGAPGTGAAPPSPMAKPKVPGSPSSPEEEAKKETAVLGRPTGAPRPKKDTSRVQVVAAKPITADSRPPVKLIRENEPSAAPESAGPAGPVAGKGAKPAPRPASVGAPSGADAGLSIAAMVLALAVAGYLAYIAFS
jgi:hypothetical protein